MQGTQARPLVWEIPHVIQQHATEQLSLCAATIGPVLQSPQAALLRRMWLGLCFTTQEAPKMRSPGATTRESLWAAVKIQHSQ